MALESIKEYLETAGQSDPFNSLDLDEEGDRPAHPIKDFDKKEKKLFLKMFDEPLKFPKNFTNISPKELMEKIEDRILLMREVAGMMDGDRFMGKQNYLCKPYYKERRFTGRLVD